ncbi:hypothetical protein GGI07_005921 [Coemansia sp. Benny D115]|nr:hypothetical protein GGI07_005921 [Coemansia sp. Benny D115]
MKGTIKAFSTVFVAACALLTAQAQTYIDGANVKGAEGMYNEKCVFPAYAIRSFPVLDPDSEDLRCRSTDVEADVQALEVKAGDDVVTYWRADSRSIITTDTFQRTPFGPCTAYLAKADTQGEGKSWFKIYHYGVDESKHWCTNTIVENDNTLTVRIPYDIEDGEYYMRVEVIDLRYATKTSWEDYTQGPGFFPMCILINVTGGTGTAVPKYASIPGIYKAKGGDFVGPFSENDPAPYKVPGPEVYQPGSGDAAAATGSKSKTKSGSKSINTDDDE